MCVLRRQIPRDAPFCFSRAGVLDLGKDRTKWRRGAGDRISLPISRPELRTVELASTLSRKAPLGQQPTFRTVELSRAAKQLRLGLIDSRHFT